MALGFRKLPSPRSLLAFEAAARNLSFTEAAKELNVTRVAVSRQVSQLESFLGIQLFLRHQSRIELTRAGRRLARVIFNGFQSIAEEIQAINNTTDDQLVTLATTSGVSTYWIMPNIGRYRLLEPLVDFRLLVSQDVINLAKSDVDLAIRYGTGNWPGATSTLLRRQMISPLCSQKFLQDHGPFEDIEELTKAPLLDFESAYDPSSSWPNYFRDMGKTLKTGLRMSSFDSYINFVQAVLDGQGVGLLGAPLMQQFIDSKILVPALDTEPLPQHGYYLCQPEGATYSKVVEDFRVWLLSELCKG
ncbi:LysR family transcriptional regulator, glycine cleavage system transcriptional activator [Shimia gijangensis]|uniref:LysR family transcriptional regulator, glycine cleavage system transcriptional activator n=1 Tax=Shimia gijangensis TaxID=1470563 RepID=A0A1M6CF61_9RHOB|nr:LysR substrate-binding domain-containing protein [Shimia gijangensis]SHI59632.1 LysR family transcriptional regulator, glycine cleavage system transcriptional activator [Shimia gijangensis]